MSVQISHLFLNMSSAYLPFCIQEYEIILRHQALNIRRVSNCFTNREINQHHNFHVSRFSSWKIAPYFEYKELDAVHVKISHTFTFYNNQMFYFSKFIKLINEYYQNPLEKQNICHWKQCSFH